MRTNFFILISALFLAICGAALGEESVSSSNTTSMSGTDVVASFKFDGNVIAITLEEYQREIRNPYFTPPQGAERGLEGYVKANIRKVAGRLIVLALAQKERLENDPEVKQTIERTRDDLLIRMLQDKITKKKPEISPKAIADRYNSTWILYKRPAEWEIVHVHVDCDNPEDTKEMENAKSRAEEALKKIDEGADFAEIAKEYSTGPATAKGELVKVDPKELNPVLEESLRTLKIGEYTGVLEVRRGYTIAKILKRTPEGMRPLEEVRDQIRLELENRELKMRVKKYFDDYGKKNELVKSYEGFDEGSNETVLYEFDDVKYTKGEFLKAISDSPAKETITSASEPRNRALDEILQRDLQFHAALDEGLDKDEALVSRFKAIESDLLYQRMLDRLVEQRKADLELTEQDLREAYETLKNRLLSEKEVKTQSLQFKIEMDRPGFRPPSKKAQADVYWMARDVMKRVRAGEDFGAIIKETDPDQGDGITEMRPLRGYISPFREAIDKLAVGEVGEPILSKDGFTFYVIKLLEVKEPRQLTFEESKAAIEPYAARQKHQKVRNDVLDKLTTDHDLALNEANVAKLAR